MESEKLTGWQPIETAPKDGTEFLSAGGTQGRAGEVYPTKWLSPGPYTTENGKNAVGERRFQHPEGFYWAGYDGFVGPVDPAVWCHKPAPPGTTRAPAEQTGWRDIETAPKDGTEFLALVSNGWHALVSLPADGLRNEWPYLWWRSSDRHSYPVVQTFPADTDWDATSTLRLTHWQPLPAPPGTTRAPADLRSALEVETIERCAEIADSHVALGYMSGRERDYCHQHGGEIAEKIRALAPTKGDRS